MQKQPNQPHLSEAPQLFLIYVRTKMLYQQRMREEDGSNPVHIPLKEIEQNFFVFPRYVRKAEIQYLIDIGELEVTIRNNLKGHPTFYYKALRAGAIDLSLLKPNGAVLDELTTKMKEYLHESDLKPGAPTTQYFDVFLQNREAFPDLFFIIDRFSGRVHTPVTNFHRSHRPYLLIQGKRTASLDVATMQPLLLGKILKETIGENEYSNWIDSGKDIYTILQLKTKLTTRDEGKKRFFEMIFSKPNNALERMFGASNWIKWINDYKSKPEENNPHTIEKEYSNLAWLLQTTEVKLMRKVWEDLVAQDIHFLSVHDEIIVRSKDLVKAEEIFNRILSSEVSYFKLNSKNINN